MTESDNIICELSLPALKRDEKDCLLFVEKDGKFGGYKPAFLKEDVPVCFRGFIICSVCDGLMRGACGVGDPQVFMCSVCASGEGANPLQPNRDVIMVMDVYCPIKSRGCCWEGTVSSLETHLDSCDYFLIDCDFGCGLVLARFGTESHLTEACIYRKITCDYCAETHRETDSNLHLEVCVDVPLTCINGCGAILPRKELQSHAEAACPNTWFECEFKEYGCDQMIARKDLETHKDHARLSHMEMMMQSGIQSLNEELDRVNRESASIQQQIDSLVEDNMAHANILSHLTRDYSTLKSELKVLKSDSQKSCQTLQSYHSTFVNWTFKPLANQVEVLIKNTARLETEIAGKVSTVEPLTNRCKDLEYLSLFQHKRTFKVTHIFEEGSKCLSENWEELRRNTTRIVRVNCQVVSDYDNKQVLRITGVFSMREHSHTNISLCIVLLNYDCNCIHKLYRYSSALIQGDTESVCDVPVQEAAHRPRSSSVPSRLKRSHRTSQAHTLADIPIDDIKQEGVCVDNCIFIQVYHSKGENETY